MTQRPLAAGLLAALLCLLLAAPAPAQPQQPPLPQPPLPQTPQPRQPLPQIPQQQQPHPQMPSMPQRPTVEAAPTFAGAALHPGSRFVLFSVAGIQTVQGFCSDPDGNHVCLLLAQGFAAKLNGQTATVCRLAGADLTCTLPSLITLKDGDTVTVSLGKAAAVGQAPAATSRSFTAFGCAASLTGVTNSGNAFTLAGTGLVPALPAFTRTLRVSEEAQGQIIARIPSTITSSSPTALGVTLDQPTLSRKILRFQLDTTCPGWSVTDSTIVLRDATPQGGPSQTGKTTHVNFRMPGASDTNAALDASSTPQVWAPGATAPAANVPIVVGNSSYAYQTFLVNRGTAIANLSVEFTTTGPLALGFNDGTARLPVIRKLGDFNATIPLSCSVRTPARFRCEVPAFPQSSDLWQVLMDFFSTGTAAANGSITFHTFGPTATDQFESLPLTIVYDAANTADRALAPLTFTSAVVAGTNYTRADMTALAGAVVRASVINKGPATLNLPIQIGVTVQSPKGATGEWQPVPGAPLPAGCTNDPFGSGFLFFRCSLAAGLAANQTVTIDLPIKLGNTRLLNPPRAVTFWPACAATCLPKGLEVSVSFLSANTPALDPDRRNDRSPAIAGPDGAVLTNPMEAVTICPTTWTVSEPTQNGEFAKLRCGP